mgnify:FL=1
MIKQLKNTHMKKYSILLLSSAVLFLSSCLKDKEVDNRVYGINGADEGKIVELSDADGNHGKTYAFNYEDKALVVNVVEVRLTSNDLPKNDVTVTLTLAHSAALVNDWNAANGTSFVNMPGSLYTIPSLTVTIPAGQRSANLVLNTNAINYDPSTTYALGFKIASISDASFTASGNFNYIVATFGAKNQYDGRYRIDFCFYHPGISPVYGCASTEIEMHTISGNTCKMYFPVFGGYYGPILNGAALSAFGSQEPAFTVLPGTNKVNVYNSFAGAVTFYTTYTAASGYDSRYEPSEKKFYVKYGYNLLPGPTFDPANTREWTETISFLGP